MLECKRFINQIFSSNCYVVFDKCRSNSCIIIDPASEKSLREIDFLAQNDLLLDFIILTHEHTDHNWGVNSLLDEYPETKVICTEACKEQLPKAKQAYFALVLEDPNYEYHVKRVDLTVEELHWSLDWNGYHIKFIDTKGHSVGSMCIEIEGMLFSGDTLMQYKPHIDKKTGSKELYEESVKMLSTQYSQGTIVYPGHGERFEFKQL